MNKSEEEFLLELYNATRHTVYGICFSIVQDHNDAENCTSEVFLLSIEKIETLRKHPNPKGWIYKSAYNFSSAYYRKKEMMRYIISLDEYDNINLKEESFEDKLINDSSFNELINCIYEKLGTKDRELFESIYISNLDNQELAKKYGISIANVYARKSRLVKKIKKILKKCQILY